MLSMLLKVLLPIKSHPLAHVYFIFLKILMCSCVSKPNPVLQRGRRVFPVTECCVLQEVRPHSV